MKRTIILLTGLTIVLLFCLVALANDPPHNDDSGVPCGECHGDMLFATNPGSLTPEELKQAYNHVCLRCHVDVSGSYHATAGPTVGNHDKEVTGSTRTWPSPEPVCTDCHHPHYQTDQFWYGRKYYPSEYQLATGQGVISGTLSNPTRTIVSYTGLTLKSGWTAGQLAEKTSGGRGAMLLPNRASPYNSRIIESIADNGNGTGTITVKGSVTAISATGFAVAYGQVIKRNIPYATANGQPVEFLLTTGSKSFAVDESGTGTDSSPNGICQVCHTQTQHWRNDGTLSAVGPEHDGMAAGVNCLECHPHFKGFRHGGNGSAAPCGECHTSESHSQHLNAGYECSACHDVNNMRASGSNNILFYDGEELSATIACSGCHETKPNWGGSACLSCHAVAQNDRAPVGAQLAGNSHHIQGQAVTDAHCYQCHWEADDQGRIVSAYHGGVQDGDAAVDLVVYGVGSRPTDDIASPPLQYMADGSREQIASLNTHCLGCHSDQNNSTIPFGDGKTPKQYAWDGYSIDARYSQNGPSDKTTWGKYTGTANAAKKNIQKSFSAHGNAQDNFGGGWSGGPSCFGLNITQLTCPDLGGTWDADTGQCDGVIPAQCTQEFCSSGFTVTSCGDAGGIWGASSGMCKSVNQQTCITGYCNMGTYLAADYTACASAGGLYSYVSTASYICENITQAACTGSGNAWVPVSGGTWKTGGIYGEGLDFGLNPTRGGAGAVSVACFDCHNSHGSGVAGVVTSYDNPDSLPANGGILKDTSGGGSGYPVSYKPVAGGSSDTKNEHKAGAALCFDCHLTPDGSGAGKPWGYQATFAARQAIIGYFDTEKFAPGTAAVQKRYPYKGLKKNAGGHFWASSRTGPGVDESGLDSAPMHNINGLCTPCHDPHGVSPSLGANQQYGVPLLKGTWLTSPYLEDAAPASTTEYRPDGSAVGSTPGFHIDQNTFDNWEFSSSVGVSEDVSIFGGLCLKCHTNDSTAADIDPDGGTQNNAWGTMDRIHDTVKGWGAGNKHKFSCSKCHTPHNGSALPRLMVTNCLGFNHRGRVAAGGSPGSHAGFGSDCGAGSGSGKFPGGGFGEGDDCEIGYVSYTYGFGNVACHDSVNGSVAWPDNQVWNQVTPWVNYPPAIPTVVDEPNTTSAAVTLQYSSTDPEGDAIEYYIEIDDASNFSSPNYNSGWIAGTDFTVTVGNNTTWYWHVKARDTGSQSGWSATDSFMVSDGLAPGQVTLASPAIAAKITTYPGNVTFTWNAQPALAQYRIWVDNESGFTAPNTYDSGWINTTSQAVDITTAGTYYWRVQARDSVSGATGTLSVTWDIVVDKPPSVPVLVPEPDTTATSITLDWSASTDPEGNTPVQYYLEIDDASNFSSPNYFMNWSTSTSYSLTLPNNIWYWRVKAKDSLNVESAWSAVDIFDIYIPGAPAVPTLLWPTDGYYDQVGFPAGTNPLQWNAASGATEYYCEYWGASSGNSGWVAATSFNPGDLADNNYFYWRVKARNGSGESGWSTVWSWYDYWAGDSCPFIFTWNGSGYEYETDIQGPVIGLPSVTPAARSVVLFQPTSIVLHNLAPNNGKYLVKLRETLDEITYLDEVKLLAVDYPAGYELVSSTAENTYSYGYVNPEKIYTIRNPQPPVSAFATNGDDILASVAEVDNVFAPLNYDAPEYITLDFGSIANPANSKLVIDGWTVYSAGLRTNNPVQPHVEVRDPAGNWVTVVSFGEPAGDLKRMVVPLGDVFQNSDQRIRLHLGKKSGGRWRLDRVMLDDSVPVPVSFVELDPSYGDLYHAGRVPHNTNSLSSRIFAEDGILPDDSEAYGYGKFTRYGDVLPLLVGIDDKFVIMRHGDAVDLEFTEIQPPGAGMARTYLLKTDIYYKSFRVENNVEPLPFHGMSIYPPADGESYPTDPEHVEYLETYNTREYIEGQ